MRQRSTHEAPVDVPAIPATVQPGGVVDWPDPIAGFEPVEDQTPPEPETAASKPAPKKRAAAPATDAKE
ncbi:hypothetical protein [Streptomyces noursei]|uniref:hypothetical protein n=1 Tax=Streptomyces noursei TaxID=1971 RepID=UPI0035E1F018